MRERTKSIYLGNTFASGLFAAVVVGLLLWIKEIDGSLILPAFLVIYVAHFIFTALFAHWYLASPRYRHFVKRMNIRGYFMLPFGLVLSIPFFVAIILYVNEWSADQPFIRYGIICLLFAVLIPMFLIWEHLGISKESDLSRRSGQRR